MSTVTFLTNNGGFRLGSLLLMNHQWMVQMVHQKSKLSSLTSRKLSTVFLIVFWLKNCTVRKSPVIWISSNLLNWVLQVGVLGERWSRSSVISGVPQRSVLGPLLIYIDLVAALFSLLMTFCFTEWSLASKSLLVFKTTSWHWIPENVSPYSFQEFQTASSIMYVHGNALKSVSSYRYLGILFFSDLSWSTHIKEITSQARNRLGFYTDVL